MSFTGLKAFKAFLHGKRTSEHTNGLVLSSVQDLAIPIWPFLLKYRAPWKTEKLYLSYQPRCRSPHIPTPGFSRGWYAVERKNHAPSLFSVSFFYHLPVDREQLSSISVYGGECCSAPPFSLSTQRDNPAFHCAITVSDTNRTVSISFWKTQFYYPDIKALDYQNSSLTVPGN